MMATAKPAAALLKGLPSVSDLQRLLSKVESLHIAVKAHNQWIGTHGHSAIGRAESMYDSVIGAQRELLAEIRLIDKQFPDGSIVNNATLSLLRSLGESVVRIKHVFDSLACEPPPNGYPFLLKLSANAMPLTFGQITVEQLESDKAELQRLIDFLEDELQLTPDEQRDKFCFEEKLKGKSYKEINVALKVHPTLEHFEDARSVRGPIKRRARRIGVDAPRGEPGRPSGCN
jgi:hypothetical protein